MHIHRNFPKLITSILICSLAISIIHSDSFNLTPYAHAKNFQNSTSAANFSSIADTTVFSNAAQTLAINAGSTTTTGSVVSSTTTSAVTKSPAQTAQPNLVALYIEYLGDTLKENTFLTKKDFLVTAVYENNIPVTITDYEFNSPTYITNEGDTIISVSYKGIIASCTVSYIKDNTKPSYNITFDSNGGSEVFPILSIAPGSTIRLPESPTRYGYWFRGWYTDSSFQHEFEPNTRILQDYTLYAQWLEKENPHSDTMSAYLKYDLFDNFSCKLTVDLTGQNYGSHTLLDSSTVDNKTVIDAAKNISFTKNYFVFSLDVLDCSFREDNPIPVTINIPQNFSASNTRIFFSPDKKQILGTCQGAPSGIFNYTFYAYHPGTYIVMDVPEIEPTPTPIPVEKPSISISLASQIKVNAETNAQIKFKNFDESKQAPDEIIFTWKSSNKKVAKVSVDGIVSGIKAGTATITATSADKQYTASSTIKVIGKKIAVTTLTLNKATLTLKKGKTFQIKPTIKPANATTKTLKYSSDNQKIATVSKTGKITAKKKGSCIITAKTTDGSNIRKKIKVIVK